jgi:hypothetical protein
VNDVDDEIVGLAGVRVPIHVSRYNMKVRYFPHLRLLRKHSVCVCECVCVCRWSSVCIQLHRHTNTHVHKVLQTYHTSMYEPCMTGTLAGVRVCARLRAGEWG